MTDIAMNNNEKDNKYIINNCSPKLIILENILIYKKNKKILKNFKKKIIFIEKNNLFKNSDKKVFSREEGHKETKILILSIILSLSTYFFHAILNNFLDTDKAAVPIWAMCSIIIALKINLDSSKKEIS